MTYLLSRIQLSHICREIADVVPPSTSRFRQIPYDDIIHLDRKLQSYLASLPFYFKLDQQSRRRAEPLEDIMPDLTLLRFCITRAAHSRRVKLHQRYLLRHSQDPRYAYSRQACLESARVLMQYYGGLTAHENDLVVATRMGIAVQYMHMALTALVSDLCFNPGMDEEGRVKREVSEGLRMFDTHEHIAGMPLAGDVLRDLQGMLGRYGVFLDEVAGLENSGHRGGGTNVMEGFGLREDVEFSQAPAVAGNEVEEDSLFDDFWHNALQRELNPDLDAWDGLFSALDSRPL
jgi:hypothetical protein